MNVSWLKVSKQFRWSISRIIAYSQEKIESLGSFQWLRGKIEGWIIKIVKHLTSKPRYLLYSALVLIPFQIAFEDEKKFIALKTELIILLSTRYVTKSTVKHMESFVKIWVDDLT